MRGSGVRIPQSAPTFLARLINQSTYKRFKVESRSDTFLKISILENLDSLLHLPFQQPRQLPNRRMIEHIRQINHAGEQPIYFFVDLDEL